MAVSMQWKLLAAAAAFTALAFGACGDDKNEGGDNKLDAGGTDAGGGNALVPIADLDDGVAGSPCTSNADCKGANATCAKDPADTESVAACTGACNTDANCGTGGTCVKGITVGGAPGLCSKVCTSSSECGADLECRQGIDFGSIAGMLAGLLGDAGAGTTDGTTQATPTTCQGKLESVSLANGIVGKACTDDTACGEGTCRTRALGINYPGGYCTGDCFDSASCGNTGGCGRGGIAAALGAAGSCVLKCTSNSDCRTGYECRESTTFLGAGTYCVPATATDGGVGDGGASDAAAPDAATPDAAAGDASTADAGADAS